MKFTENKVFFYPLIGFFIGLLCWVAMYISSLYSSSSIISGTIGVGIAFALTAGSIFVCLPRVPTLLTLILEVILFSQIDARGLLETLPLICAISAMAAVFGSIFGTPVSKLQKEVGDPTDLVGETANTTGVSFLSMLLLILQLVVFFAISVYLSGNYILALGFCALFVAAAVPHLLSLLYKGVTTEILSTSILITHIISLGVVLLFPYLPLPLLL